MALGISIAHLLPTTPEVDDLAVSQQQAKKLFDEPLRNGDRAVDTGDGVLSLRCGSLNLAWNAAENANRVAADASSPAAHLAVWLADFLAVESIGRKYQFRIKRVVRNWSPDILAHRLRLIAFSLGNLLLEVLRFWTSAVFGPRCRRLFAVTGDDAPGRTDPMHNPGPHSFGQRREQARTRPITGGQAVTRVA